jgi:hypothetical protein
MQSWPFEDPENVAVITVRQIVDLGQSILYVTHDAEDGCWQFLTGGQVTEEDAMVVSLKNMCKLDPTLYQLANLPMGWIAERDSVDQPWVRTLRQI